MKRDIEIVCIILFDENKDMLLQQRTNDDAYNPGNWALFGGGIQGNESKIEALKRETKEELGYALSSPELVISHEYEAPNKKGVKHVFVEKMNPKKSIFLGEGKGYAWFNFNQIQHLKLLPNDMKSIRAVAEYLSK